MDYLLLTILGLLPSFIWLCFFLFFDVHPESKRMVLKIFIWGMLSTLPILGIFKILIWLGAIEKIENIIAFSVIVLSLNTLFWATIEEVMKYLVVRYNVLKSSEFDEPVDIVLYMIIAGVGFAAFENILILFDAHPFLALPEIFILAFLRFISATIGHALWSGLIGYYMALSFYKIKERKKLLMKGIIIASLLHGLYNLPIILVNRGMHYPLPTIALALIPVIILIGSAIFIFFAFKKLKRLKSVCEH